MARLSLSSLPSGRSARKRGLGCTTTRCLVVFTVAYTVWVSCKSVARRRAVDSRSGGGGGEDSGGLPLDGDGGKWREAGEELEQAGGGGGYDGSHQGGATNFVNDAGGADSSANAAAMARSSHTHEHAHAAEATALAGVPPPAPALSRTVMYGVIDGWDLDPLLPRTARGDDGGFFSLESQNPKPKTQNPKP
jgi:hypothetical protein